MLKTAPFFAIACILLSSCQQEKPSNTLDLKFGLLEATVGDEKYVDSEAIGYFSPNQSSFGITSTKKYNALDNRNLSLTNLSYTIGQNILTKNSAIKPTAFLAYANDDAVVAWYHLSPVESKENYVDISSYNSETKRVSGTFKMTFIKEQGNTPASLPDTVQVTDGKFELILE